MFSRPRHEVAIRDEWLRQRREPILEQDLAIVDAHHHLWTRGGGYLFKDYLSDVNTGHNIIASIHVQCISMYRADGPEHLRPVGETEFIDGVARESASGSHGAARICAGIVGFANLLHSRTEEVIEAHLQASGRFRGIRFSSNWDADPSIQEFVVLDRGDVLNDAAFRTGFSCLSRHELSFDAWVYHPHISQVTKLASAFPETSIIVNHAGGLLGRGPYARGKEDAFREWRRSLAELSRWQNVCIKIGGFGMPIGGHDFPSRALPPSSEELAEAFRPAVETCIELFGPRRCMFESNFPADKAAYSYATLWNAYKRMTQDYAACERAELFAGTAARTYRLHALV